MKKEYICPPGKKSKVVIEDLSVKFKDNPTLILGFAGIGLLGPIIGNTLVEQIKDLKEIGFITSEMLPPISTFYDGVLKHPFRLYYSQKYNIILGIAEVPFQLPSAYSDLAKTICNWALSDDINIQDVILFQGIPTGGMIEEFKVYYASEHELIKELEEAGIKKVEKGIIVGPEATIINEALTNRLEILILFTPVYQIPTPEGAASLINILNKKFKMNINTSALLEEGKEIKEKMLELAEKTQELQSKQLSEGTKDGYSQYYQ
ncbi:MAG: proteasome assembly chaperone family protein [Candidatus Lokiarchaeota archaeon]|nr:proteasome assembly chaperone family protein [Candidatus Lokiarchaeota archaeon]